MCGEVAEGRKRELELEGRGEVGAWLGVELRFFVGPKLFGTTGP